MMTRRELSDLLGVKKIRITLVKREFGRMTGDLCLTGNSGGESYEKHMELHEPYYDGNNSVRDVYQALREYFPHMESYWKQNGYESGYERIYRDDGFFRWLDRSLCKEIEIIVADLTKTFMTPDGEKTWLLYGSIRRDEGHPTGQPQFFTGRWMDACVPETGLDQKEAELCPIEEHYDGETACVEHLQRRIEQYLKLMFGNRILEAD